MLRPKARGSGPPSPVGFPAEGGGAPGEPWFRRSGGTASWASTLPPGISPSTACPDGWKQVDLSQGRFLVGLPAGASADLSNAFKSAATSLAKGTKLVQLP